MSGLLHIKINTPLKMCYKLLISDNTCQKFKAYRQRISTIYFNGAVSVKAYLQLFFFVLLS